MKQVKIIPFDLSLATSDNVYTRDGRKARIICTDYNKKDNEIIALFNNDNEEVIYTYNKEGYYCNSISPFDFDLVIHQEIDIDFEPFQKVLVRNNENEKWHPDFFSHESIISYDDNTTEIRYWTIGNTRRSNRYCIPYDDFKHLCNTTNNSEF